MTRVPGATDHIGERILTGLLLGAVLCGPVLCGTAAAQTKTGTSIGQFLLVEPGARVIGMGGAGVALGEGIQASYFNPGALGTLQAPELQFTHGFWYAGIDYDYAAAALPVRSLGNILVSLTALNSGDIDVRTVEQPLGTGEKFSVQDMALGLGFGRQITSKFSAGFQLNYLSESIWLTSSQAVAFNMGTVYRLRENGLRIGASLSNFGGRAKFAGDGLSIQWDRDPDRNGDNGTLPAKQFTDSFPVPVIFRVGLGYPHSLGPNHQLLMEIDAFHPSDNSESVSAGAEWSWKDTVALRAGYQNLFQTDSEVGPTLGVGLRAGHGNPHIHFDYAWAAHERLQDTHRVTFGLAF